MRIIENICLAINFLGINRILRFTHKSRDLCLMYHGVVPDNCPIESWLLVKESQFRKQLRYLAKHWEIVHIGSYIKGDFQTLKPKAIITFDDGYKNNYIVAYPILKEFSLPATIYTVTDFIGSNEIFWFDKVIYSIQNNALSSIDFDTIWHGLGKYTFSSNGKQRWNDIEILLQNIKALGSVKAQEVAQRVLEYVNPDRKNLSFFMPLTIQQIREMSKSRLIEIGAHTAHHEILTDITHSQAEETISRSVEAIKNILGKPPIHFCYPNGNYSEGILELMQKHNFVSAMTVRKDFINSNKFMNYEIPRISVGAFDSINLFKVKLSGLDRYKKY